MPINRRSFLRLSGASIALPAFGGCEVSRLTRNSAVPRSPFDENSTAEEVTAEVDLSNKIAVVTGCTSGIGYETMRVLAKRGALVVGTGRTQEKAAAACSGIEGRTSPVQLELSDLDSVVRCANIIRAFRAPIDILVCNAGMRGGDRQLVNGVERNFAVNHLGHFVLANRLLDRLYFAEQGRVVVVASRVAYENVTAEGIKFDDLSASREYSPGQAYAQSKLANVLFSLQLSQLLKGSRITSNSLHPGVVDTNIVRNLNPVLRAGFGLLTVLSGKTVAEGAATSCFVATSPTLGSVSGAYFEDCNALIVEGDSAMHKLEQADRLWRVSEELTRDYLVEHSQPDASDLHPQYRRRGPSPEQP